MELDDDCGNNKVRKGCNTIKIFIWLSWDTSYGYKGFKWQQCLTFANISDYIIAYNYKNVDNIYLDYICKINNIDKNKNFIWIDTGQQKCLYDIDICSNKYDSFIKIMRLVQQIEKLNKNIIIYPYRVDTEFLQWYD
eukprot:513631_1